jgi:hypothetical protein
MRSTLRPAVLLALAFAAALAGAASAFAAAPGDDAQATFGRQGMSKASAWAAAADDTKATPRATCAPGSHPETGMQGRVPAGSDAGFTCNTELVGREGKSGGFKVQRFVDKAGHECAYYDTTLLFPTNIQHLSDQPTGAAVLDMSDPAKPVRTDTLVTPAMQTPHESLVLNEKRGLLVAVMGNLIAAPGVVDIYDVNEDCRHPVLQSSLPVGLLGHESGFAPDGNTFYATSLSTGQVTAVDVTDPKLPKILWVGNYDSHGLTLSDDGNRAYLAERGVGLVILDVSEIQARKPNPQVHEVSRLGWDTLTIPQVAQPVTIGGHPFLVEIDEFSTNNPGDSIPQSNGPTVGAARIIDIADETKPQVVSNIRLEVNNPENRGALAADPGAGSPAQGYAGHYCSVPQRKDPGIVACSFIASGLRVFDIRDPYKPRELAYYVAPAGPSSTGGPPSNYAMSGPAFAPERREIWYSDGNTGFYAVRVAKGVWPFGEKEPTPPARCVDRRKFSFRLHHGPRTRVVRVVVFVNGKRVLVRRGRNIRRVTLRRLPRRRFKVRIVSTHSNGSRLVSTRVYRGCKKGRPTTRGHHGRG